MSLDELHHIFAQHGIHLVIHKKTVKNINFRMQAGQCHVSVPIQANHSLAISVIHARLSWAIRTHQRLLNQTPLIWRTLWGEPHELPDDEHAILAIYRQALHEKIPLLQQKWQPIVGRYAKEVRLKKMKTRWGTCNPARGRIWLCTYLPAYPYECTEYVFVHELCHLIHANHSANFWREVKKAMPDYQTWHDTLKHKTYRY
ncbi:MAG: DUF45 domain-containing protein [Moraxella sp.]|uniref:M48 family metallopeptidase n=1 Tax=Moraxella sp. TaxID=479 RepID=UPI0026DAC5CD|nr:YgjP-like metallopeptidase domain-containing protein [Moraxella sp.]MDO4450138.1 DUF45 domain-containing protein [Moraxella sp.]